MSKLLFDTNSYYDYGKIIETAQKSINSEIESIFSKIRALNMIEAGLTFYDGRAKKLLNQLDDLSRQCGEAASWLFHAAEEYEATERTIIDSLEKATTIFSGLLPAEIDALVEEFVFESEKDITRNMQDEAFRLLDDPRFSEEKWDNASDEERKEMLNEYMQLLIEIMGLENTRTPIIFDDSLKDTTMGQNCDNPDGTYTIKINPDYLDDPDSYELLMRLTVMHELRHSYQRQVVNNPDDYRGTVSDETIEAWRNNLQPGNYIDYDPKKDNFEEYLEQPIEYDCESFTKDQSKLDQCDDPKYEGVWDRDGNVK